MSSATATPLAPGRLPLLGHAWRLWRDPMEFVLGLRTVGKVVRVGLGRMTLYFATDPDLVHQILVPRPAASSVARSSSAPARSSVTDW
ncbi:MULTISPECIES: hypothetical protein [unclassified Streptomyces]|uniref:hypothetical protein n=1 Tax=unclassified Streptomyces TaxID=2593676 RepID=UPI0034136EBB